MHINQIIKLMIILQKKSAAQPKSRQPIHAPQQLQPDMNRKKILKKTTEKKRQENSREVTSYSAGAGRGERGWRRRRREEAIEGQDRRL